MIYLIVLLLLLHLSYYYDICGRAKHREEWYYVVLFILILIAVYNKNDQFGLYLSILAHIGVINAHFNRWDTVRKSIKRWYGPHLGIEGLLTSLFIKRHYKFIGFSWRHFEQPFLRSTFEQAWSEEPEMLQSSCSRFRSEITLFPYFFRYWQFATNMFYPTKLYKTRYFIFVFQN
jgi:hypothetical protein